MQSALCDKDNSRYGKDDKFTLKVSLELLPTALLEELADPKSILGDVWLSRAGKAMQEFLQKANVGTDDQSGGVDTGCIGKAIVSSRPIHHVGYNLEDYEGTEFLESRERRVPATLWGILRSEQVKLTKREKKTKARRRRDGF